ncbi:MAG: phosphoribosylformylglycinamidine synthase I [Halobacteriales archaeon]
MTVAVVSFGGSNCDRDVAKALRRIDVPADVVWYKDEEDVADADGVVLPGGFSYGDYLRAGAMAARTPVMDRVRERVDEGAPVLGICNGAQILCESNVVQGAYAQNLSAKFQCEPVHLRVETTDTPFTRRFDEGDVVEIPIAHAEGRYVPDDLDALIDDDRVLFRYVDEDGNATDAANPNGSVDNIAGVLGESRNVAAMMPHPERASYPLLGSDDGLDVLAGFDA